MGWSVVVVDIHLSIHIENLYYIVNVVVVDIQLSIHIGWVVVVVDIQLSIHIENLYYIVNWVERRGRGYTTIYTHREPILHSQWGGASWSWIYNYLYT